MLDLSLFSEQQRHALQLLYQSGKPLSINQLSELGCSISPLDLNALTTEQYGRAVILRGNLLNGEWKISPGGKGIHESFQKQQADESYHRDYDRMTLEIAEEANRKSALSNKIAIASMIVSVASVLFTIIYTVCFSVN